MLRKSLKIVDLVDKRLLTYDIMSISYDVMSIYCNTGKIIPEITLRELL